MDWYRRIDKKAWSLVAQEDPRMFGPGETSSNFGTPNVNISGSEQTMFDIPGIEGSINLDVSVQAVKQALEGVFGGDFFKPITDIKIMPIAGKFGLTKSQEPHTLYINEQAMIDAVKRAVQNEAQAAQQQGIEAAFTPEIGKKINVEIAKELWETIPHERQHAIDFQQELHKMFETGQGNVMNVPESHGEQAGKAALGQFRWYVP